MKQADSCRLYVPVWSLDGLLEGWQAVFPHVPETVVQERFGKVGDVARAVFDAKKLWQVHRKMQRAASKMDLGVLQRFCRVGLVTLTRFRPIGVVAHFCVCRLAMKQVSRS
ncbi:unnamed protein product [Ectocarpus sp. 13 AM-2016]